MNNTQNIKPSLWIVVKDTMYKRDPRAAEIDFVADVVDMVKFEAMLKKQGKYAYRARSYGEYFKGWEALTPRHF